ncbi:MAG TPA: DNA cytosine methyltransferase, partial [Oscillospiraceae bacterium]|nr:DNA cytosine methyltransferase [Oscillospiraceae bacterium]
NECNASLKDVFQKDLNHRKIHINHPETIKKCKSYYQYDQNLRGHNSQDQRYFDIYSKCNTLLVSSSSIPKIKVGENIWLANPLECELLQTLPKNYTQSISNSRRYSAIGNGWTVDVIVHILNGLKEELSR